MVPGGSQLPFTLYPHPSLLFRNLFRQNDVYIVKSWKADQITIHTCYFSTNSAPVFGLCLCLFIWNGRLFAQNSSPKTPSMIQKYLQFSSFTIPIVSLHRNNHLKSKKSKSAVPISLNHKDADFIIQSIISTLAGPLQTGITRIWRVLIELISPTIQPLCGLFTLILIILSVCRILTVDF